MVELPELVLPKKTLEDVAQEVAAIRHNLNNLRTVVSAIVDELEIIQTSLLALQKGKET